MNKPVPWNIKGVGFDAREAARLAAKRAGLPLGDWLNSVISARAAELGVRTEDIDSEDRLEAIASRLSDVDLQDDSAPGSHARPDVHNEQKAAGFLRTDPSSLAPQTLRAGARKTTLPPRTSSAAWSMGANADTRLNGTVNARLGVATAPLVTDVDVLEVEAEAEAEAASVAGRRAPASSRRSVPQRTAAFGKTTDANGESLDARLTSILEKLNRSFDQAERFGETVAAEDADKPEIRAKQSSRVKPRDRDGQESPATPTAAAQPQFRPERVRDASGSLQNGVPHPVGDRGVASSSDAAAGYAELHAAFKILAAKLEAQDTTAQQAGGLMAGHSLLSQSPDLTPRVDRPRDGARQERRSSNRDVESLRRDVAQLSTNLSQLSPQQSLSALEAAVRELIGRVDLSKLDGVQASVLAPVERLSREMREAIRGADPSKAVDALRHDMKALAGKVDTLRGQGVDPEAAAQLRVEIHDMRAVVQSVSDRLQTTERLQAEIMGLGEKVGELAQHLTPAMSRDLADAMVDIRGLMQKLGADGVLGTIDRKIDTLSARVDKIADTREQGAFFDDLVQQIDRAHDTLATRLAGRMPQPANLTAIEDQIGSLSAKIDTFGRTSHDVNALYGLVGGLADRIDDARNPRADTEALNALQAQIGQLMERLDRTETGNASLNGLERMIGDLFLQIELSRNVAIDAAENAARAAAQDTLRAAMDNPSLNGGELTVQTGLDVDHVSQELAELRRIQEASERRVNTTLTALNTTLERLVDRMIAERTPASEAPSAAADEFLDGATTRQRRRAVTESAVVERDNRTAASAFDPEKFLLEPGSGASLDTRLKGGTAASDPSLSTAPIPDIGRVRAADHIGGVAPLIAAARRAAQAAQASALEASLTAAERGPDSEVRAQAGKTRSFFAAKRRPLLLGLAGLVLLLGTLQIVRISTSRGESGTAIPSGSGMLDSGTPSPSRSNPPPEPQPQTRSEAPIPKAPTSGMSLLAPPAEQGAVATTFRNAAGASEPASMAAVPAPSPAVAADTIPNGSGQGLRDLAASGNAAAQFEIAVRLSEGRCVARDPKQAVSWFQRAAQQGLAPAQYRLGSVYEKGVGASADAALAVAWYEKAATQGNVRAMHNLAVMSAEGAGSKPDYGKAVTWFTKAASYGVRDSQFNLAVLFARGLGLPQNLGQSYAWFAIAAAQGDNDAVAKRDTVAAKLDAKGLADAKAMVASFHALSADPAANDVPPPPGGWDAVLPAKTAGRKTEARVSSM